MPFIESDRVLADLDGHFGGNYLGASTFLEMARAHGYQTAAIGKGGPTALQDVAAIAPVHGTFPPALAGIIVDDAAGTSGAPQLAPALVERLRKAGLAPEAPERTNGYPSSSQYNNGHAGDRTRPGTLAANVVQQQWFADVATRVVLPAFAAQADTPFVLVFWSRDPDGTQHNQGDSLGTIAPGINGETARLAVRNADHNLQQLLDWLDGRPDVAVNTDVVVTSDHGFATISRRELQRTGRPTGAESAKHEYLDANGRIDTLRGTLPNGFLAIDLAVGLQMNLFDPDQRVPGTLRFKQLSLDPDVVTWPHPARGSGLIGADVRQPDGSDARLIVAANGGSDLVYAPTRDAATVRRAVDVLLGLDYVGGVFVDDRFGGLPGTLPLSAINLVGSARLPRPAIVVTFKVFRLDPDDPQTAVQVSDTSLQEGQGQHGSFSLATTFNNMAAIGPDFKAGFTDRAPVGNADITPTLVRVLGFADVRFDGLAGRAATEALVGQADPAAGTAPLGYVRSRAVNGRQTVLVYRELDGVRYLRTACMTTPDTPDAGVCR